MTTPPLDYARISAGTAAIAGEFAAMLAPAEEPEHTFSDEPIVIDVDLSEFLTPVAEQRPVMHFDPWTGAPLPLRVNATATEDLGGIPVPLAPANPVGAFLAEADEALKAECELLAAWWLWDNRGRGILPARAAEKRKDIAVWVMNRHRVVEWPVWASEWIAGSNGTAAL